MEAEIDARNTIVSGQEHNLGASVLGSIKDDSIPSPRMVDSASEQNTDGQFARVQLTIPLPGQLVLAKTGMYSFWPAIIRKCVSDKKKWDGKWVLAGSGGSKTLRLWCAFVGDPTGAWVPIDRIQPYSPEAARQLRSKPRSKLYEDHGKAITLADEIYRTKRRLKVPPRQPGSSSAAGASARDHAGPSTKLLGSQCESAANLGTTERSDANIDLSNISLEEYSLGDLVLAKYEESCPFWPAIIRECQDEAAESGREGKWRWPGEGGAPEHICCFFIADGSETWVSVDDIKQFTPAGARAHLCERTSTLYEVQRKAIAEAIAMLKP